MLSVLTQFLSNRSQYVVVDGGRSTLVNLLSGVTQGSVLGSAVVPLVQRGVFLHSGKQTLRLC